MSKSTIGLVRVSTTGQATDGCSLQLQEEKIKAYCSLNDLELKEIIVEAGVSGRAKKREGLDKIVELIESGSIHNVVIYKLDRLSRSIKKAIELSELLQDKGVCLHSICERLDTGSPQGKLFFYIMAALSNFECDLVSFRTKEALQGKKARNERIGKIPFGQDLSSDGVHLIPNPKEQKVISSIKGYAKKGLSQRAIARKLNDAGILTKEGKEWSHKQIGNLLTV